MRCDAARVLHDRRDREAAAGQRLQRQVTVGPGRKGEAETEAPPDEVGRYAVGVAEGAADTERVRDEVELRR